MDELTDKSKKQEPIYKKRRNHKGGVSRALEIISVVLFIVLAPILILALGWWSIIAIIAIFGPLGKLYDWVEKQERKGANVEIKTLTMSLKAPLTKAGWLLIAGVGGGFAFIVMRSLGVPLWRLPDFQRVDAQTDTIIVFASGASTGILLRFLGFINKNKEKQPQEKKAQSEDTNTKTANAAQEGQSTSAKIPALQKAQDQTQSDADLQ